MRIEKIVWRPIESGGAAIDVTVIEEFGWNGENEPACSHPKGQNFPYVIAVVQRPLPSMQVYYGGYTSYSTWSECLKPKPDSK